MENSQLRVSKKKSKIARQRVHKLIKGLQKELNNKYKFSYRLVGSGKWGTIIEDTDGKYDLDYQLILTKNSPYYKANKKHPHPTEIKNDFISVFHKLIKDKECIKNLTTAITLINKDNSTTASTLINKDKKPYTVDFVIMKEEEGKYEIIRRNNKKESPDKNEYTWNKLPNINDAYVKFKKLSPKEKQDLILNHVIPRKIEEKNKEENDETKISSAELFIQEINNYGNKKINS